MFFPILCFSKKRNAFCIFTCVSHRLCISKNSFSTHPPTHPPTHLSKNTIFLNSLFLHSLASTLIPLTWKQNLKIQFVTYIFILLVFKRDYHPPTVDRDCDLNMRNAYSRQSLVRGLALLVRMATPLKISSQNFSSKI